MRMRSRISDIVGQTCRATNRVGRAVGHHQRWGTTTTGGGDRGVGGGRCRPAASSSGSSNHKHSLVLVLFLFDLIQRHRWMMGVVMVRVGVAMGPLVLLDSCRAAARLVKAVDHAQQEFIVQQLRVGGLFPGAILTGFRSGKLTRGGATLGAARWSGIGRGISSRGITGWPGIGSSSSSSASASVAIAIVSST